MTHAQQASPDAYRAATEATRIEWKPGTKALLCLDGWAGRREIPVSVAGRSPARIRVELSADAVLPGGRHLKAGETVLVPIAALRAAGKEGV